MGATRFTKGFTVFLLCLASTALLTSCADVSPRTSTPSEALQHQFSEINPEAVRVRLVVPTQFGFDPEDTEITLRASSQTESRVAKIKLEELGAISGVHRDALFAPGIPVVTSTLKLSDRSIASVRQLQQMAGIQDRPIDINIHLVMKYAPADARSVRIWADLLLWPKEGYTRVVDGGEIRFNTVDKYHWQLP